MTATSYDIEWNESSYSSRAALLGETQLNYTLIDASTHALIKLPAYIPTEFTS